METELWYVCAYLLVALAYVSATLEMAYGYHRGRYNEKTQAAYESAVRKATEAALELVHDRKRARLLITTILMLIVLWRGLIWPVTFWRM